MNQQTLIPTALCLPIPDIEALIQGRTIVALPRMFIRPGQQFSLYPANYSTIPLSVERYYRSNFLPIAQTAFKLLSSDKVLIKAWAKCEQCQILDETKSLEVLSQLTIWTKEGLQEIIRQRQHIFITYLRVYQLSSSQEVLVNHNIQEKVGKFVSLPLTVSDTKPVLSDRLFNIRKHQLQNLQPPLHPELEQLQSALISLATTNPAAKQLEQDIKVFLGWSSEQFVKQIDSDLAWINDIAKLGDRSIEQEEKKSNYQAGTDFENITRQSLNFLGFQVEEDYKGGAGGLDLFCSQPYPLVCECKAGKSIPDRTVEELDRIGKRHLQENYMMAVRLIIGPGQPTKQLKQSAQISKISIINAMTLQKLVELKAKYPGSVNLVELKQYLETGQIDKKIDEYINQVEKKIALRSHLVKLVKQHQDNTGDEAVEVATLYGAYGYSNPPQSLTREQMHEILIELSSPLTGYLGRTKGNDWRSDRFYFLRDLPTS
ncbi:hypothetical protein NIES4075_34490 [Tolypothrix sp. NIES-4075]|uniref:DUF1802 family protein n=1 Tax=Tolypothrix sp. NIES-4075 TaxID=2005459 RepID=UPI000B5C7C04|nr:DUF1802 family protein [Tolypothrix sp. NIES-4075]GAX42448.1 hypothetical protein NIES4075_34490 [Tolypothrix sp. NIES-4075]